MKSHITRTVDCKIASVRRDHTVYHARSGEIDAIKVFNDNCDEESKVLYKNGGVIDSNISHVREMEYKYEQYIIGYGYYATSSKIGFYGEFDTIKDNELSSDRILINKDTVIIGEADYNNKWDWKIKKQNDDISTSVNTGKLPDDLDGDKCVVVGSDEPITDVCLFEPIN